MAWVAGLAVAVALLHGLLLQRLVQGLAPAAEGKPALPSPAASPPVQVRAVAVPSRVAAAPLTEASPAAATNPPTNVAAHRPTIPLANSPGARPPTRATTSVAGPAPGAARSPALERAAAPAPAPASAPLAAAGAAAPSWPASALASPEPTGDAPAAPPPRYLVTLPPPFEAEFRLRRGALAGRAQWRFGVADGRYTLELQTRVLGREVGHLRSEGLLAADGLQPLRFVEGRRGRDQRAVNFQRNEAGGGRITFSGPGTELPLPAGVQDRLGWLLQVAAIAEATPALRRTGAELGVWVVGVRGDADLWRFEVLGTEPVAMADGTTLPALALRRGPRRSWDSEVRVWLDPDAGHLPLRAAWRNDDGGAVVELERESLAWR